MNIKNKKKLNFYLQFKKYEEIHDFFYQKDLIKFRQEFGQTQFLDEIFFKIMNFKQFVFNMLFKKH